MPRIHHNDAVIETVSRVAKAATATVAFAAAVGALPARAQSDADFLAAKSAYERADLRRLEAIAPSLAGHVLEPYVTSWVLTLKLRSTPDSVDAATLRAWLAQHAHTPLAEPLRVEWLKVLGARAQWPMFGQEYVERGSEDAELACHAVAYRRQRDGDDALMAAKSIWSTGRSTPDACEPLFAAMIAKGFLTPADLRARIRLASETGNARLAQSIAALLPQSDRIADREFARVDRNPAAALASGAFDRSPGGRELALYALERAARKDAQAARAGWVKSRAALPEADRLHGNARLGYHAARQHVPDANLYFREAQATPLTEELAAWRVRAALRAQSWNDVRAAVEAMVAPQREEAAWRYWHARALAALGKKEEAKPVLEALAKEFNFYGVLAAEALGLPLEPKSQPLEPAPEALAALASRSDVRRAMKLASLDLRIESWREWSPILRGMDDESLLTVAEFARRAGHNDRAINTAERTVARHDFALRYLMPFRPEFEAAAREHDVDSALLFAIARQESRFIPDIVSSAGAQGLMQLMPGTARWVARQLGEGSWRPAQIADVTANTRFGAYYFRYWLERLDSQPLATAAYNAGPGRAQAWRPATPLEGAAWIETIPFNETRDYVKKVLSNAMFYTRALGKPAVPLTERLGRIAPKSPVGGNGGSVTAAN